MSRGCKRVLIVADLHSGGLTGLTPPQFRKRHTDADDPWIDKIVDLERDAWEWYARTVESLQPVDFALVNGDCIDGRGERSGSTELITADRHKQANMASTALKLIKAKKYVMTYGTPYHVGNNGEDYEDVIAKDLANTKGVEQVKLGSHEWPNVNGLIFDMKHKIGGSSIPHGRFTAIARDRVWNSLWAECDDQPKGRVFIRSHVHYHVYCGGPDWLALTTPALQTMGTKFGSRECSGHVDYGLVHFDVERDGSYTWQVHTAKLQRQKAQALIL